MQLPAPPLVRSLQSCMLLCLPWVVFQAWWGRFLAVLWGSLLHGQLCFLVIWLVSTTSKVVLKAVKKSVVLV